MPFTVLHIPHASTVIPKEQRQALLLCDDEAADTSAIGLDEHAIELDERTLIHRVTGHRHPRVLFQSWIHGEQVEVVSLFASRDSSSTEATGEMRQVILRTSFVLGRNGGALTRLARLVRWGLGDDALPRR